MSGEKTDRRKKVRRILLIALIVFVYAWWPGGLSKEYTALRVRMDLKAGRFEQAAKRLKGGPYSAADWCFLDMYCRMMPLYRA